MPDDRVPGAHAIEILHPERKSLPTDRSVPSKADIAWLLQIGSGEYIFPEQAKKIIEIQSLANEWHSGLYEYNGKLLINGANNPYSPLRIIDDPFVSDLVFTIGKARNEKQPDKNPLIRKLGIVGSFSGGVIGTEIATMQNPMIYGLTALAAGVAGLGLVIKDRTTAQKKAESYSGQLDDWLKCVQDAFDSPLTIKPEVLLRFGEDVSPNQWHMLQGEVLHRKQIASSFNAPSDFAMKYVLSPSGLISAQLDLAKGNVDAAWDAYIRDDAEFFTDNQAHRHNVEAGMKLGVEDDGQTKLQDAEAAAKAKSLEIIERLAGQFTQKHIGAYTRQVDDDRKNPRHTDEGYQKCMDTLHQYTLNACAHLATAPIPSTGYHVIQDLLKKSKELREWVMGKQWPQDTAEAMCEDLKENLLGYSTQLARQAGVKNPVVVQTPVPQTMGQDTPFHNSDDLR